MYLISRAAYHLDIHQPASDSPWEVELPLIRGTHVYRRESVFCVKLNERDTSYVSIAVSGIGDADLCAV